MTPIKLTSEELSAVLKRVNTDQEYSAGRVCKLLAKNPKSLTVDVNRICSVGNISDSVNRRVNPLIHSLDLVVACTRPPQVIKNRFNQQTSQHLWSFYRIPKAANDADYEVGGQVKNSG